MKLVVGLGNPGKEYINTRHNVGFDIVDVFAEKYNCSFKKEDKFNADIFDININGIKIIVAKPLTYMNLSGEAVGKIASFYNIDSNDILVIHDDMDMVLGKIRVVYDSSSGGHNGIKSITNSLGTSEYTRLKIGIGSNEKNNDVVSFVLGRFDKEQKMLLDNVYKKVDNLVEDFVNYDINKLKQIYNSMNNNC